MNKDQVKGLVTELKGKVKEVAGSIVGNESLEAKGIVENTIGKVQSGLGDVKSAIDSKLKLDK